MPATITSVAHNTGEVILDNKHFAEYLDTTEEWIETRTGIYERRITKTGATSDLIVPAAKEALEKKGYTPDDIDCIIVPTVTPDHLFPSTAALVQDKIGCKNAWGFDISAACSGFVFGIVTAAKLVEGGAAKRVLLCGADKMSSIIDYEDRATSILFGDAGTACIIEMSDDPGYGILDHDLHIDGDGGKHLHMVAGGSHKPASEETVNNREHYVYQEGQPVFKAAVKGMADVSVNIMERNNLTADDIAWLVPHQANLRIIDATAKRMDLPKEKVMINIQKYGNTTAATIPMCISEWHKEGKVNKGDYLVLSSFGAGFTWGAVLLRWNENN